MDIERFIQTEILLPRLRQHGVLVVYDPEQRYRDLCLELASERRVVVNVGESSIESQAAALAVLQALGEPNTPLEGLPVYVPRPNPLTGKGYWRDNMLRQRHEDKRTELAAQREEIAAQMAQLEKYLSRRG